MSNHVNAGLVVSLAVSLWDATVDYLVHREVPRDEAEKFADKLRWEVEGLLDYVE